MKDNETLTEHLSKVMAVETPKSQLLLHMVTILPNGMRLPLKVLVDTGCEVNLVRTGLIPSKFLTPASQRVSLVTANGTLLPGGQQECDLELITKGQELPDGAYHFYSIPTKCHEAKINVDIILSFGWCVDNHIDILTKEYGLRMNCCDPPCFINGAIAHIPHMSHRNVQNVRKLDPNTWDPQLWEGAFPNHGENQKTVTQVSNDILSFGQWETLFPPMGEQKHPEITEDEIVMIYDIRKMQLRALPELEFESEWSAETYEIMAKIILENTPQKHCNGVVSSSKPLESALAEEKRQILLEKYKDTVFTPELPRDIPYRGPNCEATITLIPNAVPKAQKFYQMVGERRDASIAHTKQFLEKGRIEPSLASWSSPQMVVPKKVPHDWRTVIDYRYTNTQIQFDAYPLPRITEILQRQGKYKIWTVLDMKDGFHQIPLHPDSRDYTTMSTPLGLFRWTVLPMGMKNAPAIFQRVMDYILRDIPNADPYIDDVIIGSTGDTMVELIENHFKDVDRVLKTLADAKMVVSTKKLQMFMTQVEFCGHILMDGKRAPAPGKLLALQKWELPKVVTQLRGFLGLANYFSEYVPNYAALAGPLTSKLQLKRDDGKKGSQKPLKWDPHEIKAFEALKEALVSQLELFQIQVDKPFVLESDASNYAIGAVLQQQVGEKWVPVAFFSRKLTGSQKRWTPREQETYAIVSALRKWAGWIGFQPVLILTDHKALESWVNEHVDTPSGPAGRRARWHETLSKFDIEVKYVPGNTNIVADALSRYAYPASKAMQDCSWHGSKEDKEEMERIMREEFENERLVGLICPKHPVTRVQTLMIMGKLPPNANISRKMLYGVTTRGGKSTEYSGAEPPLAPASPKKVCFSEPQLDSSSTKATESFKVDAEVRKKSYPILGLRNVQWIYLLRSAMLRNPYLSHNRKMLSDSIGKNSRKNILYGPTPFLQNVRCSDQNCSGWRKSCFMLS